MMQPSRWFSVAGAAFAVLLACRQEPKPTETPAARPAESEGLRPMTSRDGAPAAQASPADPHAGHGHGPGEHGADPHGAVDPHSSGTLPQGHPPIDNSAPAAANGPSISGTVDAAPAVKDRIKGGALFLIARNAKSRQIVAVRRADGVTFPQSFRLSGADAMTPGTPFEGPLAVTARWSQAGDAMPAPGDIEGTTTDVAVGTTSVKVVLSDVRK